MSHLSLGGVATVAASDYGLQRGGRSRSLRGLALHAVPATTIPLLLLLSSRPSGSPSVPRGVWWQRHPPRLIWVALFPVSLALPNDSLGRARSVRALLGAMRQPPSAHCPPRTRGFRFLEMEHPISPSVAPPLVRHPRRAGPHRLRRGMRQSQREYPRIPPSPPPPPPTPPLI